MNGGSGPLNSPSGAPLPGFQAAQNQYGLVSKLLASPKGSSLLNTMAQANPASNMPSFGNHGYPANALQAFLNRNPLPPGSIPSYPVNPVSRPINPWNPNGPGTPPPGGGGNPTQRPPGPTPPPTLPPTPPPVVPTGTHTPAPGYPTMQPGQYDWGRTGDGSQTGLMAPDVQAWINQQLHGPGMNTGWRNNLQMDPNDILGSIQRAGGPTYKPGGFQAPIPGLGY